MALEEYARKRSFDKTPEPGPAAPEPQQGRSFCIHRHAARRLHYDLRIEIGGTLKSWAVPEGPTLDPSIKRLAVHVEDHPLEYRDFEGNIPRGNYGAGSMMLWDAGSWELLGEAAIEEQLARGDFKFRLHGRKITGEFALVKLKNSTKGVDWLLIKKKDASAETPWDIDRFEYSVLTGRTQQEIAMDAPARTQASNPGAPATGAVAAEMPRDLTPMLAASADAAPPGSDWMYEIKWDGVRALAYLNDGKLHLVGRRGTVMDAQYPEFATIPESFGAREAILDGEIVMLDEQGRPNFQLLQPRIMATGARHIARLAAQQPAMFFAFDLIYFDGFDLRESPLSERRRLLATHLKPSPVLRFSRDFPVPSNELLEAARAQGLEGIVAKRLGSPYRSTRSGDWVKIKISHEQEFVICGFVVNKRELFGSLILGAFDKEELVWVGNVGTGFDQAQIKDIYKLLEPRMIAQCPFRELPQVPAGEMKFVRPELVCRVKYNNWTNEGRLRGPVYVGMRFDIAPEECMREPVAAVKRAPLLTGDKDEARVSVDGHAMHFINLNKVFYPEHGYVKRDILNYYDAVADLFIPHWKDRPLSLRRYPDGIHGEGFFQKNAATGFPEWMRSEKVLDVDKEEKLLVVGAGRAELLYLAHLGCIDQNPWMSRVGSLDNPDFMLIDLDPHECGYEKIVEAALIVKRKLDLLGLTGYPKTTGGDGMHIYVPLEPVYTFEQSRSFAEVLARLCAAERPDLFTLPRTISRREKGRVYFDYMQNARGKTISAPYVLRAHPGAPVATPLEWRELTPSLRPQQFHLKNSPDRFARVGDLFAGVLTLPQRLEDAFDRLREVLGGKSAGA
ncbi:MAG: DNA ligase D [Bryobacteraceae bacterium]